MNPRIEGEGAGTAQGFLSNRPSFSLVHRAWWDLDSAVRDRVFFDARPFSVADAVAIDLTDEEGYAPAKPGSREDGPVGHGKAILADARGAGAVMYVGSHNFSATAWGVGRTQPKNIEAGVVVWAQAEERQEEWRSRRFPCELPTPYELSEGVRERGYIPASCPPHIRKKAKANGGMSYELAMELKMWLKKNEGKVGGEKKDQVDGYEKSSIRAGQLGGMSKGGEWMLQAFRG